MKNRSVRSRILMALLITGPISPLWGEGDDAFQFLQEEAKVTTASRREQSINDVPMAVDVITAEEIKASGATNISDLLRFRVGMDVLDARSVDGNRAIVAVRGFPQEFVNNLQVLVDGRSVYEPVSGGVYWDQLPVQLQDIERIEIIRGPNSALYGSGAGLGVINIITKKPQGTTTASVTTSGGNLGQVQSAESLESSVKNMAYRFSTTYQEQNGFPLTTGGTANDFSHNNKTNARIVWTPNEEASLDLFAGGAWSKAGDPPLPQPQNTFDQDFQMMKFSQKWGPHSTVEILSSRNNYIDNNAPSATGVGTNDSRVLQYDEEILHRLDWWDSRANNTYGLNYRHAAATSSDLFGANPDQEETLWRGYMNQSLKVTEKVALSGGVSWEDSHIGGDALDTNYQVASLWTPLSQHSFRASYSVAHTVPSIYDVAAEQQVSSAFLLDGNPVLQSQKLTSYEVGYRGNWLGNQLQADSSLYYTLIDDLGVPIIESAVFAPSPLITGGFANFDQAIARGVENEIKYRWSAGRSVYLNYTYEHVTDSQGDSGDVTQNTPAHKVNFGGIADLGCGFSGSVNVGYKDGYLIGSDSRNITAAMPAYWRLDARLAYALPWYKDAEVFVAGQNLAVSTHQEYVDGLTVPRTYQGGISMKFGGLR